MDRCWFGDPGLALEPQGLRQNQVVEGHLIAVRTTVELRGPFTVMNDRRKDQTVCLGLNDDQNRLLARMTRVLEKASLRKSTDSTRSPLPC